MNQGSKVGKIKDLDVPGRTLNDTGDSASNSSAPVPSRGFESDGISKNQTEARSISGAGSQGFGRGGSGPDAAHGMSRGPFAARTKLTSRP